MENLRSVSSLSSTGPGQGLADSLQFSQEAEQKLFQLASINQSAVRRLFQQPRAEDPGEAAQKAPIAPDMDVNNWAWMAESAPKSGRRESGLVDIEMETRVGELLFSYDRQMERVERLTTSQLVTSPKAGEDVSPIQEASPLAEKAKQPLPNASQSLTMSAFQQSLGESLSKRLQNTSDVAAADKKPTRAEEPGVCNSRRLSESRKSELQKYTNQSLQSQSQSTASYHAEDRDQAEREVRDIQKLNVKYVDYEQYKKLFEEKTRLRASGVDASQSKTRVLQQSSSTVQRQPIKSNAQILSEEEIRLKMIRMNRSPEKRTQSRNRNVTEKLDALLEVKQSEKKSADIQEEPDENTPEQAEKEKRVDAHYLSRLLRISYDAIFGKFDSCLHVTISLNKLAAPRKCAIQRNVLRFMAAKMTFFKQFDGLSGFELGRRAVRALRYTADEQLVARRHDSLLVQQAFIQLCMTYNSAIAQRQEAASAEKLKTSAPKPALEGRKSASSSSFSSLQPEEDRNPPVSLSSAEVPAQVESPREPRNEILSKEIRSGKGALPARSAVRRAPISAVNTPMEFSLGPSAASQLVQKEVATAQPARITTCSNPQPAAAKPAEHVENESGRIGGIFSFLYGRRDALRGQIRALAGEGKIVQQIQEPAAQPPQDLKTLQQPQHEYVLRTALLHWQILAQRKTIYKQKQVAGRAFGQSLLLKIALRHLRCVCADRVYFTTVIARARETIRFVTKRLFFQDFRRAVTAAHQEAAKERYMGVVCATTLKRATFDAWRERTVALTCVQRKAFFVNKPKERKRRLVASAWRMMRMCIEPPGNKYDEMLKAFLTRQTTSTLGAVFLRWREACEAKGAARDAVDTIICKTLDTVICPSDQVLFREAKGRRLYRVGGWIDAAVPEYRAAFQAMMRQYNLKQLCVQARDGIAWRLKRRVFLSWKALASAAQLRERKDSQLMLRTLQLLLLTSQISRNAKAQEEEAMKFYEGWLSRKTFYLIWKQFEVNKRDALVVQKVQKRQNLRLKLFAFAAWLKATQRRVCINEKADEWTRRFEFATVMGAFHRFTAAFCFRKAPALMEMKRIRHDLKACSASDAVFDYVFGEMRPGSKAPASRSTLRIMECETMLQVLQEYTGAESAVKDAREHLQARDRLDLRPPNETLAVAQRLRELRLQLSQKTGVAPVIPDAREAREARRLESVRDGEKALGEAKENAVKTAKPAEKESAQGDEPKKPVETARENGRSKAIRQSPWGVLSVQAASLLSEVQEISQGGVVSLAQLNDALLDEHIALLDSHIARALQ